MKKDFDELKQTNLGEQKFVRPSTGMVQFMAWLHDGRLDWDEIFAEKQEDNYRAAMQFIRENCGNAKTAPLTMKDYKLLGVLITADRSTVELAGILDMPPNQINALLGKGLKNGLLYTYKSRDTTYAALTLFGKEFYLTEVV